MAFYRWFIVLGLICCIAMRDGSAFVAKNPVNISPFHQRELPIQDLELADLLDTEEVEKWTSDSTKDELCVDATIQDLDPLFCVVFAWNSNRYPASSRQLL